MTDDVACCATRSSRGAISSKDAGVQGTAPAGLNTDSRCHCAARARILTST